MHIACMLVNIHETQSYYSRLLHCRFTVLFTPHLLLSEIYFIEAKCKERRTRKFVPGVEIFSSFPPQLEPDMFNKAHSISDKSQTDSGGNLFCLVGWVA